MLSFREGLQAAGLTGIFSLRDNFATYPRNLREILRVLTLPDARLDAAAHEELWEKSAADAQGIACLDTDTAVVTLKDEMLLVSSSSGAEFEQVDRRANVAHFADQTSPRLEGCGHFSDLDHSEGLIFFVFEVEGQAGGLFACDVDFNVVGYTVLDADASDSCCAVHPWTGLLYTKDRSAPGKRLRAYDVSAYRKRFEEGPGPEWGTPVDIERRPAHDIDLRDESGTPMTVLGDIQGIAFSPNGRVYLSHWTSYENLVATFFVNYLSIYSGLTGRRMWFSDEIDFEGDGDEIEGLSLVVSKGELYVIQVDNDVELDEYYLRRWRLPDELVAQARGQVGLII